MLEIWLLVETKELYGLELEKIEVWQATDRDMDNVADTVERFAPNIKFDIPNGPCYSADGHLYIAEKK